jgi:hypothetical protein
LGTVQDNRRCRRHGGGSPLRQTDSDPRSNQSPSEIIMPAKPADFRG